MKKPSEIFLQGVISCDFLLNLLFAVNTSMEGDGNVETGRNIVPVSYVPLFFLEKLDLIWPNYNDLKKPLITVYSLF